MTRDDIIRMAREAWGLEFIPESDVPKLERFANLVAINVAASEREWMQETNIKLIAEAVAAEREAFEKVFPVPEGVACPVTHRIVPVELLERCSREFQSMEGTELAYPEHGSAVQCYHELRAIIDKEST